MNKIFAAALCGASMLALAPTAALAKKDPPAAAAPALTVAIANLEGIVANAAANKAAAAQRVTYYKPQADAYQAKTAQVQAQLRPLYEKADRDSKLPAARTPAGQAALQQQAAAIQAIEERAQAELNEIRMPVVFSQEYVNEQIFEKLDGAVKTVMAAKRVSILLKPDSVYLAPDAAVNISADIQAELDRVFPAAQLVPPAGWEPRQLREARAQQAAQAGGQPAAPAAAPAAPAGPQTDGR